MAAIGCHMLVRNLIALSKFCSGRMLEWAQLTRFCFDLCRYRCLVVEGADGEAGGIADISIQQNRVAFRSYLLDTH